MFLKLFDPLGADMEYTPHCDDVTCSGCDASCSKTINKNCLSVFERGENLLQITFCVRFRVKGILPKKNYLLC